MGGDWSGSGWGGHRADRCGACSGGGGAAAARTRSAPSLKGGGATKTKTPNHRDPTLFNPPPDRALGGRGSPPFTQTRSAGCMGGVKLQLPHTRSMYSPTTPPYPNHRLQEEEGSHREHPPPSNHMPHPEPDSIAPAWSNRKNSVPPPMGPWPPTPLTRGALEGGNARGTVAGLGGGSDARGGGGTYGIPPSTKTTSQNK